MATLSQLYNAYLEDDPNVGEMTYDPFGWNIEQTFADQDDDDDDGGGGGGEGAREDYGDTFGVDPAKLRLPSSFQPTNIGYYGDEGTVGLPGHITQRGPGRQFMYDNTGTSYDDIHLYGGPEEDDSSWFKRLREGFSDNPLLQGIMAIASPFTTMAKALPVNETSILQNEMLGQGFALDDLRRIVNVSQGKRDDVTYGYIDYVTPENVMAGYRPTSVETFDKRIAKINAGKASQPTKDKYIDAIKGAKEKWLTANEYKKIRVNQLKRKKGTKVDEPSLINIQKETVDKMPELVPDASAIAGMDDAGMGVTHFADDEIKVEDLFTPSKTNIEKAIIGMPEHLTSDIEREEDRLLIELAREKAKEKKLAIASMDDAGMGVTYPEGPTISDLKTPLEQMIDAESRIIDLPDPGKRDTGGGGYTGAGTQAPGSAASGPMGGPAYGPWRAKGGLIRKKYGDGGIVDLL